MSRHRWEKLSHVISECKVCGCIKNTRCLTPAYTLPGKISQHGKAPDCIPKNKYEQQNK